MPKPLNPCSTPIDPLKGPPPQKKKKKKQQQKSLLAKSPDPPSRFYRLLDLPKGAGHQLVLLLEYLVKPAEMG